jgi:putative membrane protein
MWMNGNGMLMMGVMGLLGLGLIAAVIALVVWLARTTTHSTATSGQQHAQAEMVLRHRYAAGEIDDEEYQRRLSMLRGQPPGQGGTRS